MGGCAWAVNHATHLTRPLSREQLRQAQLPAELGSKGAGVPPHAAATGGTSGADAVPPSADSVQLALNQVTSRGAGRLQFSKFGNYACRFNTTGLPSLQRPQDLVAAKVQLDGMARRVELAERERERILATLHDTQVQPG
jgi:hypothetical protein